MFVEIKKECLWERVCVDAFERESEPQSATSPQHQRPVWPRGGDAEGRSLSIRRGAGEGTCAAGWTFPTLGPRYRRKRRYRMSVQLGWHSTLRLRCCQRESLASRLLPENPEQLCITLIKLDESEPSITKRLILYFESCQVCVYNLGVVSKTNNSRIVSGLPNPPPSPNSRCMYLWYLTLYSSANMFSSINTRSVSV